MIRLIYASTMSEDCTAKGLVDVFETAQRENAKRNVTGILCYDAGYFLQCLEGPRAEVNEVYCAIVSDPRHTRLEILDYARTDARMFSAWSMAYMSASRVDARIISTYCPSRRFAPYEMTPGGALQFLSDVVGTHRAIVEQSVNPRATGPASA